LGSPMRGGERGGGGDRFGKNSGGEASLISGAIRRLSVAVLVRRVCDFGKSEWKSPKLAFKPSGRWAAHTDCVQEVWLFGACTGNGTAKRLSV
jgi:hypothetical protein